MKALSYMLYLFFLVGMSSCCFGPWYYKKSGQMHVKGFVPWFGKYEQTLDGADPSTFRKVDNFHVVDSNHVYVLSPSWNMRHIDILKDADPATFEVLSKNKYTRDAHHVWYETRLVPMADSRTFEVLEKDYARTDSLLFYRDELVRGADPETVVLHKYYIEDKNDVYWENRPFHVSDRESFAFVPEKEMDELVRWAKDKNYVYYLRSSFYGDSAAILIPIADYDSFEALDLFYARDKVQVYYRGSVLSGAEPSSFVKFGFNLYRDAKSVFYCDQRVCDYSSSIKVFNNNYFTDGSQIYFAGYHVVRTLEHVDLATFSLDGNIAKDTNQVYCNGIVVEGADPSSFHLLRDNYSRDKNHVFYKNKMIEGADVATFEQLGGLYSKDKSHIFYGNQVIAEADFDSFKYIDYYAKDKSHCYFAGDAMQDVDYETFESLGQLYARDRYHVYYWGKTVVGADPATFEFCRGYEKDKSHIINNGEIVEGADPSTFQIIKWEGKSFIARDKYREYKLKR